MSKRDHKNNKTFLRRIVTGLALLLILCGAGSAVKAQNNSDQEKVRNIRRLLTMTKAGDFGAQIIEQSLAQIKLNLAQAPAGVANRVLSEFEKELRQEFTAEKIIESVIPIYDKHLTNEDVVNISAFYQTPTGQKFIAVLPQIGRESLELGVRRGREVSQRVLAKLQAEGVLKPAPPAAPAPTEIKQRPRRATRTRRV